MEKDLGLLVEEKLSRECFLEETGVESDANGENDSCKFFVEGPRSFGETIQDICKGVLEGQYAVALLPFRKKHRHLLEGA